MGLPLFVPLDVGLFLSELALVWRRSAGPAADGVKNEDRGSLRWLWITITVSLTTGHFLALNGIGPPFGLRGVVLGWLGVGLFGCGVVLRVWAIRHLGRFFTVSVALARDHRVVEDGPYRWARHPSYTGLLLEFAGVGVVLGSWTALAVILIPIFVALAHRMGVEERALQGWLGETYLSYARRTRRLVPGVY